MKNSGLIFGIMHISIYEDYVSNEKHKSAKVLFSKMDLILKPNKANKN